MRKALALMSILFLIGCAALVATHISLDAKKEEVQYTESWTIGDKSAAMGTSFTVSATSDYKLYWDTTYTIGSPEKTESRFDFSRSQKRDGTDDYKGYITFYSPMHFGIGSDMDIFEGENNKRPYLAPAKDVATRCEPGQEYTEIVRLRDYYEYIPAEYDISIDNMAYSAYTDSMRIKAASYFLIPVPENYDLKVTVEKNDAGATIGVNYTPAGDEYDFYFDSYHVITEEAGYILISGSDSERQVDLSHFTDGYGIYQIPIVPFENTNRVLPDVDNIRNVYPMELDGTQICAMELSEDKKDLLLFTRKNGMFTLTVIDIATMTSRQVIDLVEDGDSYIENIWEQNSLLVFTLRDEGRTVVLQKDENNLYQHVMQVDFMECVPFYLALRTNAVYSFDGNMLTGAALSNPYDDCGVCLTMWNEEGLVFAGQYDSSLNTSDGTDNGKYEPKPTVDIPLILHG